MTAAAQFLAFLKKRPETQWPLTCTFLKLLYDVT